MVNKRKDLYLSANTVLKDDGILSVFPKHNKADLPMWQLENLAITDISEEIGNSHFVLIDKALKTLIDDDHLEKNVILNFKKAYRVEKK